MINPPVRPGARSRAGAGSRLAARTLAARTLAASLPLAFLGVFLFYPLARVFALGFRPLAAGGWTGLAETVRGIGLAGLLVSSTLQALASTALSLAVGIPAAYVFARCEFPGRKALSVVLAVPFVLPTVVVASAFAALGMGRGIGTVLAAHVFYNVSIVVRIVGTAWANLDPRLGEAARVLGARRGPPLAALMLRLAAPAVAAAALLVFCYCFTSFGVVLLLGGPRVATLETEIWRQAVRLADLGAAGLLALLQLAATGALMTLYARLQRRLSTAMRQAPAAASRRRPRTPGRWIAVATFGYGTAALVALPLAGIAAGSLVLRSGISLGAWTSLFRNATGSLFWTSPLDAGRTSLLFASFALVLALAVGLPAAYAAAGVTRREGRQATGPSALFDLAVLLPLGTSAVTLGFGFLVALDRPPLDLRASALLVPIAHALVALPLVTRSLSGPIASLDPRLREASAVLGARPGRSWRAVDLPVLGRAIASAGVFAFTVSIGEFAASSLLARPEFATIPVVIFNRLGTPGELNRAQALAMSTVLMVVCGLGVVAIERLRARGPGSGEAF
ncbi:MAG: iron ABC transporter permease [Spirochaetes bacterium]|nr:iron ABC transporter permease [Spirochaetota bacterium]